MYFRGLYRDFGCAHFNALTNKLIKKQLRLMYGHIAFKLQVNKFGQWLVRVLIEQIW